ncbi:MAG TPA: Wzt carbohydrate-binding domain-containing protein [Bryobacteraceae bacterium]|nr:Wzt carbohydrate-binding domain-containing protein [Bryobacteraceae bacterium]
MIEFRNVNYPPLSNFSASAPDGAVIGILGERGSGKTALLQLAAGLLSTDSGEVVGGRMRRYLGPTDKLNFSPVDLLALDNSFALHDAIVRARGLVAVERLRRGGATILLVSHEAALLRALCDEVWWLREGQLSWRGNPHEVIEGYNGYIADKFRDWGETLSDTMVPALRRGDGRAEVVEIATLGSNNQPTMVWTSGEVVTVRVRVRYNQAAASPVIGIMIRTRVGFEVYGTNTEAERVEIGSVNAGDTVTANFTFRCDLCPQEYTLTAASHDPDGTAHDWLEDAVSFTVTADRYTAGVANLRARVAVHRRNAVPAVTETV